MYDAPSVRAGSILEINQSHVSCFMFHVFPEATLLESTAGVFPPGGERPSRRAHSLYKRKRKKEKKKKRKKRKKEKRKKEGKKKKERKKK